MMMQQFVSRFSSERGQAGAAAVLGVSLIIAAGLGSYSFYRVRTLGNTLTVTGSALQDADADAAKWTVGVSRTVTEGGIPGAQAKVASDAQVLVDFFKQGGIPAEGITVSTVFVDQQYQSDTNAPKQYNVHEDVSIRSNDPQLVEKLSKNIGSLLAKGIVISPSMPEYYVTTLPAIRIALIGKAVADAKARAVEITKTTGQSVGQMQSAAGGVVQVMAPNSVGDISDYGSYDTSTIHKQVMVTARATFYIR